MRMILKSRPYRGQPASAAKRPPLPAERFATVAARRGGSLVRRRVPERTMGFGQVSLSQTQLFTGLAMLTTCIDEAADLLTSASGVDSFSADSAIRSTLAAISCAEALSMPSTEARCVRNCPETRSVPSEATTSVGSVSDGSNRSVRTGCHALLTVPEPAPPAHRRLRRAPQDWSHRLLEPVSRATEHWLAVWCATMGSGIPERDDGRLS